MLRGSKPGERRGGRKRDTPNRRTVLTDRILAIGEDHPTASRREFLQKLLRDQGLPADTRMAVAPKCFPAKRASSRKGKGPGASGGVETTGKTDKKEPSAKAGSAEWNPQALEALFGIVQDPAAGPKARRKAAWKIAEFLLPKTAKKEKALTDEYGFRIKPSLAIRYRDIELELRALKYDWKSRDVPAMVEKRKKLQARSAAIRARLEAPSATRYGFREQAKDHVRVLHFYSLRDNGVVLTEAQNAEDALAKVRMDLYSNGPETMARRRREELGSAKRMSRMLRSEPGSHEGKVAFLRQVYPGLSSEELSQIYDEELRDQLSEQPPPVAPPISPAGPSDGPESDQIQPAGPAKIDEDSL
jgi:hypothetical protein